MSGHSKWSTIKHKKGVLDAKRGKLFTKVIKEITIAAKSGGENPECNSRLRTAIAWAKSVNMPLSNIQNAIKKSSGEQNENYETIFYEGFAPANVAIIVKCLTENRNRTATAIRTCFSKNNGNLGTSNTVRHMFENIALFKIPHSFLSEDDLLEFLIESPVKDINAEDDPDFYLVTSEGKNFGQMQSFLEEHKVPVEGAELILEAENKEVISDLVMAEKVITFISTLEDQDDVQKVYSNFEISEEVQKALENS